MKKMGLICPITLISEITKMGMRKPSPLNIIRFNMMYQLLQSMFSTVFPGTADSVQREDKRTILPDAHEKRVKSAASVDSIADDIKRLEEAFSNGQPLESGQEINVTLQELLRIVPRNRPRKDAYKHLQRVLKDEMGVILTIKSRKDGKKKD